jgi:uncharacterized protein involved in cysteine biosynthesis
MGAKRVEPSTSQLRSFGLIVGGLFAVISVWPLLVRGGGFRVWAAIPAGILFLPAVAYPAALKPIYKWWMKFAEILGWINTRIILSLGFYLVFAPLGAILRASGKDPLCRRLEKQLETYRILRTPRPGTHMRRQF